MNIEQLKAGLQHPTPGARATCATLIGLVEESRLLETLKDAYPREPDPRVKERISWAGQRLQAARQRGYTPLEDVFRVFGIDDEIEHMEDENEAQVLRSMEMRHSADLSQEKVRGSLRGAALKGGMGALAGGMLGSTAAASMMGHSGVVSPGESYQPKHVRLPAPVPTDSDFGVQLKRLQSDPDPKKRASAALDIMNQNNPAGMVPLTEAYLQETDAAAQKGIERAVRQLYISALYYAMTQDGSVEKAIARRIEKLGKEGKLHAQESIKENAMRQSSPEELAEIMRKAQEKKRNSGKR